MSDTSQWQFPATPSSLGYPESCETPLVEPFPQRGASQGVSESNDQPKTVKLPENPNPIISISGPVNLNLSCHEPMRQSKKRKIISDDVDSVLETITGRFDRLMRNIPNTYERVPSAATMMNCSLPQIHHQGIYPDDEYMIYPIDTYKEASFPNAIECVKYIYRDRLAAREHIDWECRRLCLRLVRLRELKALEEQYSGLINCKPNPDEAFRAFADANWYKAQNNDEDLIEKIRDMELKIREIREIQEQDTPKGSRSPSVATSSVTSYSNSSNSSSSRES